MFFKYINVLMPTIIQVRKPIIKGLNPSLNVCKIFVCKPKDNIPYIIRIVEIDSI